jgi:transcriptional regulator with XRE-family HTH domain
LQGCVAFLPFARVSLKSLIPKPYDFEPTFVGDHIRKKRLQLGLYQKEVAQQLGVNTWTILNWEKGHTEPPVSGFPAIIKFLGYDPHPEPVTIPEQLISKRRKMGWTVREAATVIGIDPGTWGSWERGQTVLYLRHRMLISKLLGCSFESLNHDMAKRWKQSHKRVR